MPVRPVPPALPFFIAFGGCSAPIAVLDPAGYPKKNFNTLDSPLSSPVTLTKGDWAREDRAGKFRTCVDISHQAENYQKTISNLPMQA